MAQDAALSAEIPPPADQGFAEHDIVLRPLSHPQLGEIRIEENLFAVGRTEAPFVSYPADAVADLSRRHARIFCEYGAVYIADLDSKNGTTVNGVNIRQKISRLHDGDEICFGRGLTYQVRLGTPGRTQRTAARLLSLTLAPREAEAGIQPIVITQFPFLISKSDEVFARYKDVFPQQVHYLSRRHAHIFLKSGEPYVEDLGSTNGTFVNGVRLEEHAVHLAEGDVVGFGGHHFVYVASLQKEYAAVDPTVTRFGTTADVAAGAMGTAGVAAAMDAPGEMAGATVRDAGQPVPEASDKTTFVAAADSFLDIFCMDQSAAQEEESVKEEKKEGTGDSRPVRPSKARGRTVTMLLEAWRALRGDEGKPAAGSRRGAVLVVLALAASLVTGIFMMGGSAERQLQQLVARGEHEQAVDLASRHLSRHPHNVQMQALGTEALLKTYVPRWLAALEAGKFDEAKKILGNMQQAGIANADAQPLVGELEWMGRLASFAMARQQANTPIRIYADEEQIKLLLTYWNADTHGHQRALARIASHVPAFREAYAEALSHLRRLQSDDAVYLAAMERLKATVVDHLEKGRPQELKGVLDEYAEKYPRIAGLDVLRSDLRKYIGIDAAVREHDLGAIASRLEQDRFVTPPFQARLHGLAQAGILPPPELLRQYQAVSGAWRAGDAKTALSALEKIDGGAWKAGVARDLAHKRRVVEQFSQLKNSRQAKGNDERLMAFYAMLEPDDDTYFLGAIEPELRTSRDSVLSRAQEKVARGAAQWRKYQESGAIDAGQRRETGVSEGFRTQARLLSQARADTVQGLRLFKHLQARHPTHWETLQYEIETEITQQRNALIGLQGADPALVRTKLDLLGLDGDGR